MGQASRFRVVAYNVENLYDTLHDAGFDDTEFLPSAERRWDARRYRAKLNRLARTLAASGGEDPVALAALCEVENDSVVHDLCRRTSLARSGFEYIVTRSADRRGIDVALIYQPLRFRVIESESLRIVPPTPQHAPTRDLLRVSGRLISGDTLDVFVCHLPSRRGGAQASADYRLHVARTLRRAADSVMQHRQMPLLVALGDFNDGASDPSVAKGLGALPPAGGEASERSLVVLSSGLKAAQGVGGTYKYRGRWEMLDQMIVSGMMLRPASPLFTRPADCRIFAPGFLLEPDPVQGGVRPARTYQGPIYHGGYSDHLPLVADFWLRE